MHYLCNKFNLSLIIYTVSVRDMAYVENGREIKGTIGKYTHRMIASGRSQPFRCRLIGEENIGIKLENGSYDGALGLVERGAADAFLRALHPLIDSKLVKPMGGIWNQNYLIGHVLNDDVFSSDQERAQIFKSFDLHFIGLALIAVTLFFAVSLMCIYSYERLSKDRPRRTSFRTISNSIFGSSRSSDFFHRLISYGFLIFTFITVTLLQNNIKTEKVVVNTDDIITNEEQLFRNRRTAVWMEGEDVDLALTQTAPHGTFLNKLYLLKNTRPITIAKRYNAQNYEPILRRSFWLTSEMIGSVIINVISSFYPSLRYYFGDKWFFTIFNSIYRRAGDEAKLLWIDKYTSLVTENGLHDHLQYKRKNTKVSLVEQPEKAAIYYSMAAFIADNTSCDQIGLNYYLYLFCFTILFQLLLLCINILEKALWAFHFSNRRRPGRRRRLNASRSNRLPFNLFK